MMSTELAATAIDIQIAMHPAGAVLKRKGVGSFVGGRWADGQDEPPLPIAATVHAMKSKDILDLPEGLRHTDMRVLHTRVELRAHTDDTVGDMIEYKGRDYKVLQIKERPEGAFTRAVIGHNHVRTNTI